MSYKSSVTNFVYILVYRDFVRDRDFSVYELACWNTDRRAREADNSIWTTIAAGKCDYYGERAERKSLMRHSDFHVLSYFFE